MLGDLVYLSVRKKNPGLADVWLFETGTRVRVELSRWSAWLSEPGPTERPLHPLETVNLQKVLPELRRRFPNAEALLAMVDWEAKEAIATATQNEWDLCKQTEIEAIQNHNNACRAFVEKSGNRGLTCPHSRSQSRDIEFVDYAGSERKSFFVCTACGRSFGHDL